MNEDAVDMSVWLRRGDPVITQERLAKGDVAYNKGIYFQEYPHIIDWMLDKKIITAQGHNAGYKMIVAHIALGNLFGTEKTRKIYLSSNDTVKIDASTLLTRVMREMTGYQSHYLDRILFQKIDKRDKAWIYHCKESIEKTFDKLAKVLDEVKGAMITCELNR